ncbi:FAD-dependent monooxygenase [Jeotgalibacillus salarius]|uniref:FAD-binding protein n=1 Tax=Jeotgalibacillus salarius TaxID=546023 RepID=A0A4Y8LDZ5_9BACL|nr:FAD-dependent monooxygenase [Jeotgalibacillus salarius]TFE00536.1 FAD-binding protein [Jeotgalibacillus salarius]
MAVIETDVLIIGAGPAGLMAANVMQKRGVDYVCLEKKPGRSVLSKALGIQARSLELFEFLGVNKPFLKRGYPGPGAKLHLAGKHPSYVEMYHIKSRYPYLLIIPQHEIEEILENHLNDRGGEISREHEVLDIVQKKEGVYVTAAHHGKTKTYLAKYLLACDGAHSKVRKELDVPFEGEDEGITFFTGDVEVPEMKEIHINLHLNDRGAAAFFPYKDGTYRVVGFDRTRQGGPRKREMKLQELQDTLDTILDKSYKVENPKWLAYFGTAHRQVPNYRVGNVFFVGDAAHVNNPLGGQGMNIGLEDVGNLCWKIDTVLKGYAGNPFLDTYHEERAPVAREVIRNTTMELKLIDMKGLLGKARNWSGKAVLTQGWVQSRFANELSHVHSDYDKTPINQSFKDQSLSRKAIQAGERVPDQILFNEGTTDERLYPLIQRIGYVCLIYIDCYEQDLIDYAYEFAEKANQAFPDMLKVYLVARGGTVLTGRDELPIIYDVHRDLDKNLGMQKGSTLFIRPDGHVGFHDGSADVRKVMAKLKRYFI